MAGRIRAWLRGLLRRRAVERVLDEEVRACVEILTEERVRAGVAPEAARREALLEIGHVERVKEQARDARPAAWLEAWGRDLRHGARLLRRQPWLAAAAVATLTIGIAAPTSVFSLLSALAFRAPVSADPDAYFRLVRPGSGFGVATLSQYLALRDTGTSARELAAWSRLLLQAPLGLEDATRVSGLLISCNLFRVIGVTTPVAGRLLTEGDCASNDAVAVLDARLWRARFGSDPEVVGGTVRFGGIPVTVVGVVSMPPFQHQWDDPDLDVGLWFPYTAHPAVKSTLDFWPRDLLAPDDTTHWLDVAGLLAPGVTRTAATAELRLLDERTSPDRDARRGPLVLTDGTRWAVATSAVALTFAMALILPALILLVACTNAAGLLLSHAIGRQREMAARLALGATTRGLMRLLLLEATVVAGLAGVASLVPVIAVPRVLVRVWNAESTFGSADALTPDWRVFAFLVCASALAAVVASIAPALEARNPRLAETLQGRQGLLGGTRTSRMRRTLVAIQIGTCVVLLVTAATFWRAAADFMSPGFRTDDVVVAQLPVAPAGTVPLAALADAARELPWARSVAYADLLPLAGLEDAVTVRGPDVPLDLAPMSARVSPTYFEVLDIPMLAGRSPAPVDASSTGPEEVVFSRQLARRLFGEERNALGRVIAVDSPLVGADDDVSAVVVGIAEDRPVGLAMTNRALTDGSILYRPLDTSTTSGFLIARTSAEPQTAAAGLQLLMRRMTGSAKTVRTFEAMLEERLVVVRRGESLLVVLGGIALLLTLIGLAGAVTTDAARRSREFAIRLTLGASPGTVRRLVVLGGLRPVPIGLGAGVLASWGALRVLETTRLLPVPEISGAALHYAGVALVVALVITTVLALIARSAAARDPLPLLRDE